MIEASSLIEKGTPRSIVTTLGAFLRGAASVLGAPPDAETYWNAND